MSKKIKKVTKKQTKKVVKKVINKTHNSTKKQELVITVRTEEKPAITTQEIAAPIQTDGKGKKMMLVKSWMSEKQVIQMVQRTPARYIHKRPAKGGGMWDYVSGAYVKKLLNFTFAWNWDFIIDKQDAIATDSGHGQVITTGRLIVKDDAGHLITKSDNGKKDIAYKKETKIPMDLGNDYKASATDCLKRCAYQLGIASDVYGKEEFIQDGGKVTDDPTPPAGNTKALPEPETKIVYDKGPENLKPGQVIGPDGKPTYLCIECDAPISETVANYSQKMFGRKLCREHQSKK
jgi:hypothetical protein